ncbi:hypothetical protein [Ornithinibacillus sp. FSL M8-0202]
MDITFSFQLTKESTTKDAYQLGFLEADLTILVNGHVFFHEPYITIAELGVQLGEWIKHVNNGRMIDMNYRSIDHDEPIINFVYRDHHQWRLTSIWQKFSVDEIIPTNTLLQATSDFLHELHTELNSINYVVKLDKYLPST